MLIQNEVCKRILGTLDVPGSIDPEGLYLRLFSRWHRRVAKKYALQDTQHYKKELKDGDFLVDTDPQTGEETLRVGKDHVPWVVLALHFMTGHSCDTEYLDDLLKNDMKIQGISQQMIEGIISWSIPGMRLETELLQNESAETKKTAEWNFWGKVYHRHLISEPLNPIYGKAGVVFFALCTMADGEYAILFIDYLTKACNFAPPFAFKRPRDLGRALAKSLDDFKRVYGHPAVLFCMNPCQGRNEWLGDILQRSIKRMAPSTTPITLYRAPHQSLPHRIADVFEGMHDATTNCQTVEHEDPEVFGPSWDMVFAVNKPSIQSNSFMQHTLSGRPELGNYLWSAALPGPVTIVNQESWSRIDIVDPFSGATFGRAVDNPLPEQFLSKITKTMQISRHLALSSDVSSSKALRFDQISRNLVTYLVLRKHELVPKRGAGNIIGRVRKRARNTSREDAALTAEQATRTLHQLVVDELDGEEICISEESEPGRVQRLAEEAKEEAAREEAWMKAAKEEFETPVKLRQATEAKRPAMKEEDEESQTQVAEEETETQVAKGETQRQSAKEEAEKQELAAKEELAAEEEAEKQSLAKEPEKQGHAAKEEAQRRARERSASKDYRDIKDDEVRSRLLGYAAQQEQAMREEAEKTSVAEEDTTSKDYKDIADKVVQSRLMAKEIANNESRDYKEIADQEVRSRLLKFADQHRAAQKMAELSAEKIRRAEMKRAAERERLQAEWRRTQARRG